jgi:hypothetical protein
VFDEPKKPLADLFPGVSRRWDDGWVALTLSVSGSDGRVKLGLTPDTAPHRSASADHTFGVVTFVTILRSLGRGWCLSWHGFTCSA